VLDCVEALWGPPPGFARAATIGALFCLNRCSGQERLVCKERR
jgi:hypothetical protein